MRDINLGTCATIVGTITASTPPPPPLHPSNVEICLCHTASSGHFCFSTLLGGRGALGSGERGTWERKDSFLKSSKDLLHYSMLFLEMSQVFLTSIVAQTFYVRLSNRSASGLKLTNFRNVFRNFIFIFAFLFQSHSSLLAGESLSGTRSNERN